ncbi:sensor histidine kinase YesM [Paenibacillus endophyticus]|uniref:Sensor histidine kinase YesM n=1 Tax=Paenibacillus endophyticus TaxID=1294268 RepID=A0A7W5C6Z0_9BACL|nr:sensor histidine kinase [Paenibacillus endophyticus]MBB3152328.1 sensor histidine kinase YesM [Paenibacillus endophyticus]
MKIRTKLILSHLLVVLFLLGSLGYVLVKRSTDLVFETITENNLLSLSQVSSNLDNKLTSYEEITNTLFLNRALDEITETRFEDNITAYQQYFDYYQPFVSAVQTTKDIHHFYLYSDNPTFLFSNVFLIDETIKEKGWYKEALNSQIGGYWTGAYLSSYDNIRLFSYKKRLNNFVADSPKVVSIEIKLKVLYDLVSEESKTKRYVFALADGSVLMDTVRDGSLSHIQSLAYADRFMASDSGSFIYKEKATGNTYQILFKTLDSHNSVRGMKVISYIPINDVMPKVEQLRSMAVALYLIAFGLTALFISAISVGMTRRLTELSMKMKRVHKDNFESFVVVKGKDEVAQLGEMFNMMVRRLGQLISEVYQSEIDRKEQAYRTKEVELYALQTQINPHFLFNVLNMIRGKLLIIGERDTAKVVGLLAKSFRMMLKNGGQMIKLADETEFVDNYLQIQQYRFGHKFTYTIDIPPEYHALLIPKLIIQPLVENAISHGVELNPEQSRIWITGEKSGECLQLAIGDDGLGMSEDRLAEIMNWLDEDSLATDRNIGIRNVHARLKYLYGDEYGLKIASQAGSGTTVTILIPLGQDNGGERHA